MSKIIKTYDTFPYPYEDGESENTLAIISLIESGLFKEIRRYMTGHCYHLMNTIFSAREDIRKKLVLLDGMIDEFKDTKQWAVRGDKVESGRILLSKAVDWLDNDDNVFFRKFTKHRNTSGDVLTTEDPAIYSSAIKISEQLHNCFDPNIDSDDDPEWHIVTRYERMGSEINELISYILTKSGKICKFRFSDYSCKTYHCDERGVYGISGTPIGLYGSIITIDKRPFEDVRHSLLIYDGEDEGVYIKDGVVKMESLECHGCDGFEEFPLELRMEEFASLEDELPEDERFLLELQKTFKEEGEDFQYQLADALYSSKKGISIEDVKERFLK